MQTVDKWQPSLTQTRWKLAKIYSRNIFEYTYKKKDKQPP